MLQFNILWQIVIYATILCKTKQGNVQIQCMKFFAIWKAITFVTASENTFYNKLMSQDLGSKKQYWNYFGVNTEIQEPIFMNSFTTHSSLETLRLHLTNIAIRSKTLHSPTLVVCYFYIKDPFITLEVILTRKTRSLKIYLKWDLKKFVIGGGGEIQSMMQISPTFFFLWPNPTHMKNWKKISSLLLE